MHFIYRRLSKHSRSPYKISNKTLYTLNKQSEKQAIKINMIILLIKEQEKGWGHYSLSKNEKKN